MAGGIFADQPFYFNPKCVVISIVLMILYWIIPSKNPFMLPVIFLVSYIAIAWYDYLYECKMQMYSGTHPISIATLDAWAKPQKRENVDLIKNNVKNQEYIYKKKIYALHALFIAPFLFYLGWTKMKNPQMVPVITSITVVGILYHGLRLIYPREITSCVEENKKEQAQLTFIYLFHLVAVFSLLGYISYNGRKSSTMVWNPLLSLAFFTGLYHGARYYYPRTVEENC